MERGIIASPGRVVQNNNGALKLAKVDSTDINYFLLYFDKVVIPQNNLIFLEDEIMRSLVSEKIIDSPLVRIESYNSRTDPVDVFTQARTITANKIISDDPFNDWTIHQIDDEPELVKKGVTKFNSLRVEFLNCLPVPSKNVSYEEILRFKNDRRSELAELHKGLDELYLDVLRSPDYEFARRREVSELQKALANVHRVSKEKFKFLTNYSLTTDLNINYQSILASVGVGYSLDLF